MSDTFLAFLVAVSGGAWIYAKMYRSTGQNITNALAVAAASALVIFLAVTTIAKAIF